MAKAKTVAVYIGLFQPFNCGHEFILRSAISNYDLVIALSGSAYQAQTFERPFTFDECKQMLELWRMQSSIEGGKLVVGPLRDQPYNHSRWIQSIQETVDRTVALAFPGKEPVEIMLTGAECDRDAWYLDSFPQYRKELVSIPPEHPTLGLELRKRLFEDQQTRVVKKAESWDDVPAVTNGFIQSFKASPTFAKLKQEYDFIKAYQKAWESAPYAPNHVTADAVVIQSGHVLVVERAMLPGRGLWALPGGHVKGNQRLQEAAIAELTQETGIKVPEAVLIGSIKNWENFDYPWRSTRGRTFTTAFLIRLDDTKPLPRVRGMLAPLEDTGGKKVVETKRAWWMPIAEARAHSECWFEDHHAILETMVGKIKD